MPDMNSTSASLYGSRPRPGGVAWRPEDGARAHPLPNAAAASHVASARREIVAIRRSQGRIVVDSPTSRYRSLRYVTNRRTLELVRVLLVLLTDVLHQLFVRPRPSGKRHFPRTRVHHRIVDRDLVDHRRRVLPSVALDHVQPVGVRVANEVEPRPVVESDGI